MTVLASLPPDFIADTTASLRAAGLDVTADQLRRLAARYEKHIPCLQLARADASDPLVAAELDDALGCIREAVQALHVEADRLAGIPTDTQETSRG